MSSGGKTQPKGQESNCSWVVMLTIRSCCLVMLSWPFPATSESAVRL